MRGLVFLILLTATSTGLRIHQPWPSAGPIYIPRSAEDQWLLDAEMADLINVVYELNWGKAFVQTTGNWTTQPEAARLVFQSTLEKWELLGGRGGKEHLTTGYSFFKSEARNLCATIFQGTTMRHQEKKYYEVMIPYDFSKPNSIVELCGGITVAFPFGQDLVEVYNPKNERREKDAEEGSVDGHDDMSRKLAAQCFGAGTRWIAAGHSLGAGLAIMEAYCKNLRMAERGLLNTRLYSPYSELYLYGAPGFSNGNLVNLFSYTVDDDACWKGGRFILDVDYVTTNPGLFDPIPANVLKIPENVKLRKASPSEYTSAFSADRWQHHPCKCSVPVASSMVMFDKISKYTSYAKISKIPLTVALGCTYLSNLEGVQSGYDPNDHMEEIDSTWHNIINYKCIVGWRGGALSPTESASCLADISSEIFKPLSDGIDGLI